MMAENMSTAIGSLYLTITYVIDTQKEGHTYLSNMIYIKVIFSILNMTTQN